MKDLLSRALALGLMLLSLCIGGPALAALRGFQLQATNLQTGSPLPGALVTVYNWLTTTKATIYDVNGAPLANPMTADSNGVIAFQADSAGSYQVVWSLGSYTSPLWSLLTGGSGLPTFTASASILPCNSNPTASLTGTQGNPILLFGLPACNYTGAIPLPTPTPTSLGGVNSIDGVTHKFLTSLSTSGMFNQGQPVLSDIAGAPSLSVTDPAIGMAADGSDNAGKVAALMSAITSSPTAFVGYPVHFPANYGTSRTTYYFTDSLRLSRPGTFGCGNTGPRAAGTVLVFAAGVDGVVWDDTPTSVDGGYSSAMLDGCGVYSLGRGTAVVTSGSQTISSVSMTRVGSLPATTWTTGDGIIAWAKFNRTGSLTGGLSNGSGSAGTILNVTAISGGVLKVGDHIYATGIPTGTTIASFGTGTGGAGTYNLTYPGYLAAGSTISIDYLQTAPIIPVGAYVSGVSGSSLTLGGSYMPDPDAITRQSNGNVVIYRLPATLAYSITTTSGSNAVSVGSGPKKLMPGDAIWSDAFPFGATVLTATGISTPSDRTTPGAQTITITDYAATNPIAASVTHSAGSGALWLIPAAEKRRGQAHARKTYTYGFPVGLQTVCTTRQTPALNCTTMRDTENYYEASIIGRWVSGNNVGASLASGNEYISNSLTDIYEGGTIGSKYVADNSNSAEAGSAPYGVMAYCGSENLSSFDGMYIGYQSVPGCAGPLGLSGPTVPGVSSSLPSVHAPVASWPADFLANTGDLFMGRFTFGWQTPSPQIVMNSRPTASQLMLWSKDGSTFNGFGRRYNAVNDSWEDSPSTGLGYVRLRWMGANYTGRNHPDGYGGLGLPTGAMVGGVGQEVYFNGPTTSSSGTKFILPGGNGSNGQVLSTDGSGNTSWVASSPTPTFPLAVSGAVTSGGVPYFSSSTQMASSATLAANAIVIGGGGSGAPSTTTPAPASWLQSPAPPTAAAA